MIQKIDSNKFSLTILKVTTFSRIRQGKVSLLSVTDKQYGDIFNFWGKPKSINKSKITQKVIGEPIQLEIF